MNHTPMKTPAMNTRSVNTCSVNKVSLITALALILVTSSSFAGHGNGKGKGHAYGHNKHLDFAQVTAVKPIYKTVTRRVPERQCWTETVAYQQPSSGYRSHTGTILGGLLGGALGNELGHKKRNKQVGAVAGAILGASIGRDITHRNRATTTAYRDEERCEVTEHVSYDEKLMGYNVTYNYLGNIYHTRMDNHPGNKIKVAVDVRPVY